jgi:hypothetical protein
MRTFNSRIEGDFLLAVPMRRQAECFARDAILSFQDNHHLLASHRSADL